MKYFSRLVVVVELKSTGFRLALVFTASLSEEENGVKPCRICKSFWRIQTKLICCIEDFKVFAGNWTLELCERNHARSFSDRFRASFASLNNFLYFPEQHFLMSLSLDSIRLVWFPSLLNKRKEKC